MVNYACAFSQSESGKYFKFPFPFNPYRSTVQVNPWQRVWWDWIQSKPKKSWCRGCLEKFARLSPREHLFWCRPSSEIPCKITENSRVASDSNISLLNSCSHQMAVVCPLWGSATLLEGHVDLIHLKGNYRKFCCLLWKFSHFTSDHLFMNGMVNVDKSITELCCNKSMQERSPSSVSLNKKWRKTL